MQKTSQRRCGLENKSKGGKLRIYWWWKLSYKRDGGTIVRGWEGGGWPCRQRSQPQKPPPSRLTLYICIVHPGYLTINRASRFLHTSCALAPSLSSGVCAAWVQCLYTDPGIYNVYISPVHTHTRMRPRDFSPPTLYATICIYRKR